MKSTRRLLIPVPNWQRFLALLLLGVAATSLFAANISPGNLVIYRVGTGTAALGATATAVFLDEYTISGSLVQSIALPSSGGSALTAVGNATTEGIISRAQNGSSLLFAGYRKDAGGSNPSADAPGTVNRVVGTIGLAGTPSLATALTDSTATIRSATTVDGTTLYISTSAGIRYVGTPSGAATTTLIDNRNSRQVTLSGNTVFASNGSTALTGKVQHYGTLPTGTTAATPIVSLATADAVNGIAFFDLNPGIAGEDTLYLLSTVEGRLRKYSFDGSSWLDNGFLASTAVNLTGYAESGSVNLFLTTGTAGGTLSALADASGHNGGLEGAFSTLATAGANTAFRGVGILVPEPSVVTLGLLAAGGLCFLRRRRA